MNPDLLELLLGASTDALDAFDGMATQNIYAPIAEFHNDPSGIKKLMASADGTNWERFDGEFGFGKLVHRLQTIKADLFGTAIEIFRPENESLMEKLSRDLSGLMNDKMSSAQAKIEDEWTKLLKDAVDGVTLPNLYHDSKFIGADIEVPGGDANPGGPSKVTNKTAAVARTVEGIIEGYYLAKDLFNLKMRKPNGERYHNGMSMGEGIGVMYPSSISRKIAQSFDIGKFTANENNERIVGVKEENLNEMFPWDDAGINGMIYYPIRRTGRLMPLQGVRTTQALKFEGNLPGMGGVGEGYSDQKAWALQKYFIGATMKFEVAPGSIYGMVFVPFATPAA